jgi:hypothetical protein
MGFFDGNSAPGVRDNVRSRIKAAFNAGRFLSEVFVVVGGHWAWAGATT